MVTKRTTSSSSILLAIFICFIPSVNAIFEDQVGKFDWRQQYVGCTKQVHFDRSKSSKSDLIFVATEANVLAALRSNTGNIAWRQLHEENSTSAPMFAVRYKMIVSVGRDANIVRAWEQETGTVVWETQIHSAVVTRPISVIASSESVVFVLDDRALTALSLLTGQIKWTVQMDKNRDWIGAVQGTQLVTVIGGIKDQQVDIYRYDSQSGVSTKKQTIAAPWFSNERCVLSTTLLLCYDSVSVHIIDLSADPSAEQTVQLDGVNEVIPIKVDGFAAVRTRSNNNVHVYKIAPSQQPQGTLVLDKADTLATLRTPDGRNLLATFNSHFEVGVYDLASGKRLFDAKLGTTDRLQHAPVQLFTFALVGREYEFVTVGQDCRLDFFVVQPQQQAGGSTTSASSTVSSAELLLEWSRHEALSTIATMRMVDLPLSEAQVGIESEFNDEAGILESFVRRIRSQVNQFRRVFIRATKQIFTASSFLNIRSKSFSDWMQSLSSSAARNRGASNRNRRSTSDYDEVQKQHRSELTLERDYFNLRKIILVATLKSTLFGLDSSDGSILWRLYLGRDTIPLRESLGSETVPLFVQRTTAHYQHAALASIVLANKYTRNGVLIKFNPITGKLLERIDLPYRVKKVDMLPIVDAQNIHPLLIMDRSDKVTTHPKLQSTNTSRYSPPVHLFTFDQKGHLEGYQFETQQMSLQRVWMADLKLSPQQKIIAVSSKPISQRVHSHGKVLGDRSVLYKYSNPNLVVIAILDSVHSVLHIEFIDAVSGYVVYKAKQTKVSGPVHLIQCENWLTYSYWNEKSRRMEIAVIELYEGLEQTDELHFNSLTPTIPRVISAISQAYIFPQGVSALGVTETEQGLSTRSLLIAMPFGGIYAISKRIVDARRPLEMTPELAEEMLIPYRPELPIASEDFVNYNQTVYNIRVIKTAPSGLESTSLMFAYGLDLFFARLTPSGTFDILKDDFDHLLISVVLVGFVIASVICKKLGKNHTLKQAWQ